MYELAALMIYGYVNVFRSIIYKIKLVAKLLCDINKTTNK